MIRFQSLIEVERIDRLNVEDVLRVVASTNVKVRIVLKGNTDQIGDGILRGLAQVFSLLGMRRRCRRNQKRKRPKSHLNGSDVGDQPLTLEPHGRAYHRSVYDVVPFEFGST